MSGTALTVDRRLFAMVTAAAYVYTVVVGVVTTTPGATGQVWWSVPPCILAAVTWAHTSHGWQVRRLAGLGTALVATFTVVTWLMGWPVAEGVRVGLVHVVVVSALAAAYLRSSSGGSWFPERPRTSWCSRP